jgi:hypothetical protein
MTSRKHAFPTIPCRATFAAALLTVFAVDASAQTNGALLAAGADTEEPVQASPPQIRPSEEQMPQQSEQPKERKRTYDGPPRDELLPNERRLPA